MHELILPKPGLKVYGPEIKYGLMGWYWIEAVTCGLVIPGTLSQGLLPPILKHLVFWSLTFAQYTFLDL